MIYFFESSILFQQRSISLYEIWIKIHQTYFPVNLTLIKYKFIGNWTYRWYGGCICDPSTGCTIENGCKECGIEIDHAIDEDSGIWIFNQATVEVVVRGILMLLKWNHFMESCCNSRDNHRSRVISNDIDFSCIFI